MKQGHTSRDSSGVLYLKSAIAGMESGGKGCFRVACRAGLCVEVWALRNYPS